MATDGRQARTERGKVRGLNDQTDKENRSQESCLLWPWKSAKWSMQGQENADTKKILYIKGDPNMLMKTKTQILTKSVKPICV